MFLDRRLTKICDGEHMIIVSFERSIYAGPRPTDLAELKKFGIKRIINLQSGVYDTIRVYTETYYDDHLQFPPDFGMVEYHMPMSDILPPSQIYVKKILELCGDGVPTFIHCLSGVDRTGFVVAAIRMQILKWEYEDARYAWSLVRHPWYFWWESALKEWSVE